MAKGLRKHKWEVGENVLGASKNITKRSVTRGGGG